MFTSVTTVLKLYCLISSSANVSTVCFSLYLFALFDYKQCLLFNGNRLFVFVKTFEFDIVTTGKTCVKRGPEINISSHR